MGIIRIKIPQDRNETYKITTRKDAAKIIKMLDEIASKEMSLAINDVSGLWADRNESVDEISRRLRSGWNRNIMSG